MTDNNYDLVEGLQIAIDGPSGSGKGSVAVKLAAILGLPVLDTGLLYRYIGFRAGIRMHEADVIMSLPAWIEVMDWHEKGLFVDGKRFDAMLRSEAVAALASRVAAMPALRQALLDVQQQLARKGCVMDGRDIGTVVLPKAHVKFFLTASKRERARRRWLQLQKQLQTNDSSITLEQVMADIQQRDANDANRQHAPLAQAVDAIRIDSTTMRIDEVIERMLVVLERRGFIRNRDIILST
ncbi:MAG: (d)CMP kinase [Mariprofundales bacterium]